MHATPIQPSWLISGELPLGLLAFLSMAAATGADCATRDRPHRMTIEVPEPIRGGNLIVYAQSESPGLRVDLEVSADAGHAIAHIEAVDHDRTSVTPTHPYDPDQLIPYLGALPGLASMFEVRPEPITEAGRGTADAWLLPKPTASWEPWSSLIAIDGWASPAVIDRARDLIANPSLGTKEGEAQTLRRATVLVHPDAFDASPQGWLHRSTASRWAPEIGADRETGTVTTRRGETLYSYVVERSRPALVGARALAPDPAGRADEQVRLR